MTYKLEIDIPGLPETINQILAMNLRARMRQKKIWKNMVWMLTAGKRPETPLKRARLTLTRHSTMRPDPDGLTSSFKHIIDGLVIARVLENDCYENIDFPDYRWAHAPAGKGHCTVIVEEVMGSLRMTNRTDSNRWRLMAHMALNAKVNGEEHQEVTLANYLQQAYETGKKDGFEMIYNGEVKAEKEQDA